MRFVSLFAGVGGFDLYQAWVVQTLEQFVREER
jgi:site-specific DNA-cytosine methylase